MLNGSLIQYSSYETSKNVGPLKPNFNFQKLLLGGGAGHCLSLCVYVYIIIYNGIYYIYIYTHVNYM